MLFTCDSFFYSIVKKRFPRSIFCQKVFCPLSLILYIVDRKYAVGNKKISDTREVCISEEKKREKKKRKTTKRSLTLNLSFFLDYNLLAIGPLIRINAYAELKKKSLPRSTWASAAAVYSSNVDQPNRRGENHDWNMIAVLLVFDADVVVVTLHRMSRGKLEAVSGATRAAFTHSIRCSLK